MEDQPENAVWALTKALAPLFGSLAGALILHSQSERLLSSPGQVGLSKGLWANLARLPADIRAAFRISFAEKGPFTILRVAGPFTVAGILGGVSALVVDPMLKAGLAVPTGYSPIHPLVLLHKVAQDVFTAGISYPAQVLCLFSVSAPLPQPSWNAFFLGLFRNYNGFWSGLPFHVLSLGSMAIQDQVRKYFLIKSRRDVWHMPTQKQALAIMENGVSSEEELEVMQNAASSSKHIGLVLSQLSICAVSAAVTCLVCAPLDTLATRMVLHPELYTHVDVGGGRVEGGALWTVRRILAEEGKWGFYKGLAIQFLVNFLLYASTHSADQDEDADDEEQ
ncbi:hypothetical protein QOT17_003365 [Balamuthia mandrillaris]